MCIASIYETLMIFLGHSHVFAVLKGACYMPRPTERLTSAGSMLGTVTEPTVATARGQKYFSSLTCTYLPVHSPRINKICLFLQCDKLDLYGKLKQAIKS